MSRWAMCQRRGVGHAYWQAMLKKATTRRAKTKLFWQGSFYITTQRMPVAYAY